MNGYEWHKIITKTIPKGRIAINPSEADFIASVLRPTDLYIEVGCLWGGTAILAAKHCARVITVEGMIGPYWDDTDPAVGSPVTVKQVMENFEYFKVAHKISFVKARSYPWPIPDPLEPDVFFIDGGHGFESASYDWRTAATMTKRMIIAHDYDSKHTGVTQALNTEVPKQKVWRMTNKVTTLAVFEHA